MATLFDNEDLNGECFIVGAEGEREEEKPEYTVICPTGIPYATDSTFNTKIVITAADAQTFFLLNINQLAACQVPIADAAKIAYLRFLAVRQGLISPNFTTAANFVRYNNARIARADDPGTSTITYPGSAAKDYRDDITAALTLDVKKKLRLAFSDAVCSVAYIFRVRGHHYRDDIVDKYTVLWSRCLRSPDELPLSWQYVATHAFHAIMPNMLDTYWEDCASNARCAGALSKRYESAPAGCAGVYALKRGLDDVRMLFPQITNAVPEPYEAFVNVFDQVSASRWGGSVNCRYYGARRIRVDEGSIGALASVVLGVYEQLAPSSKLRDSPALKRLAEIAPATGGAIGLAARRAAADEKLNLIGYTAGYVTEE